MIYGYNQSVRIVGDLNVHVDVVVDPDASDLWIQSKRADSWRLKRSR